jgi:hypothetical protein
MAKTNRRQKAVTAADIAGAAGMRIHGDGTIELLDEREVETLVGNMFAEVLAEAFAPDRRRPTVH